MADLARAQTAGGSPAPADAASPRSRRDIVVFVAVLVFLIAYPFIDQALGLQPAGRAPADRHLRPAGDGAEHRRRLRRAARPRLRRVLRHRRLHRRLSDVARVGLRPSRLGPGVLPAVLAGAGRRLHRGRHLRRPARGADAAPARRLPRDRDPRLRRDRAELLPQRRRRSPAARAGSIRSPSRRSIWAARVSGRPTSATGTG